MRVGVDEAGQQLGTAQFDRLHGLVLPADRSDPFAVDEHRGALAAQDGVAEEDAHAAAAATELSA